MLSRTWVHKTFSMVKILKLLEKPVPHPFWKRTVRKLDQLDSVTSLEDLKITPGNCLEALKGDREGQYSIRINTGFEFCQVLIV